MTQEDCFREVVLQPGITVQPHAAFVQCYVCALILHLGFFMTQGHSVAFARRKGTCKDCVSKVIEETEGQEGEALLLARGRALPGQTQGPCSESEIVFASSAPRTRDLPISGVGFF